jgi:hypothetical protein
MERVIERVGDAICREGWQRMKRKERNKKLFFERQKQTST